MLTREEFARRLEEHRRVESRESRLLALVAVPFGLAQLVMIRWADANLPRGPRLALEGGVFLAYMALVGILIVQMVKRTRAAAPRCPRCRARLEGAEGRAVLVTGRCISCGADIIEQVQEPREPAAPPAPPA